MHKWLYGKEKNKWCGILDSFFAAQELLWPAENQVICSYPQQQSSYHSCTLGHGFTWLSEEQVLPFLEHVLSSAHVQ